MSEFNPSVVDIAEICAQHQVCHVVVSPGSRSAPLTLAFLRHPKTVCRTVVDERSAAFLGLGLAQQTRTPVALVCTSGTAALNYGPAIAEAYYQRIPLLVFTADRPPEWIDQNDGQTIHQVGMYGRLCRASFVLPAEDCHPDAKWHIERIISEAVNLSMRPIAGPVHVNVPLREPLYPSDGLKYNPHPKIMTTYDTETTLSRQTWQELRARWERAHKKLVVAGLQVPSGSLLKQLRKLRSDGSVALVYDIASNLHEEERIHHSDMILGTQIQKVQRQLAPDLVVSCGGPVVSKNLKLFLRKHKPREQWHLDPAAELVDTFQSLTRVLPVQADYFFSELTREMSHPNRAKDRDEDTADYQQAWLTLETHANRHLTEFLGDLPHCELSAMSSILEHLPADSNLHLGNSFIIRLASFVGLSGTRGVRVFSNRGTCGIDGTVSTAVGAALAKPHKFTSLIVGDLAFFYDRNGLWHDSLPRNLRIIIINNRGGGIFRILDGPDRLPELREHFEVEHDLTAENTAKDLKLDYFSCNSSQGLNAALTNFFEPQNRPAILEVHTDKMINTETFLHFKSIMREIA